MIIQDWLPLGLTGFNSLLSKGLWRVFNLSQHQDLFRWVALHIRWPKYWSVSFSISPSSEFSGSTYLWLTDLISLLSKGLSREYYFFKIFAFFRSLWFYWLIFILHRLCLQFLTWLYTVKPKVLGFQGKILNWSKCTITGYSWLIFCLEYLHFCP